ncbi:MAG: hypothetical protein ACLGGV_02730 [Bacteroidia bacterium]
MAKIIQLMGWFSDDLKKEEHNIYFNTDHITTITTKVDNNMVLTSINIESYNSRTFAPSIITKLNIDEVIKLVNEH